MRPIPDLLEDSEESSERYVGISLKMPASMFRSDDRDAVRRDYVAQWDQHVTAHHGTVLNRADVYVDGQKHRHHDYVLPFKSEGIVCDYCEAANRREFEARTKRPYDHDKVPRIRFVLSIERRVFPREQIEVPLVAPVHRKGNPRIQKKWNKQAAGKTVMGYRTEVVELSMTKYAFTLVRKELAERWARGRR